MYSKYVEDFDLLGSKGKKNQSRKRKGGTRIPKRKIS